MNGFIATVLWELKFLVANPCLWSSNGLWILFSSLDFSHTILLYNWLSGSLGSVSMLIFRLLLKWLTWIKFVFLLSLGDICLYFSSFGCKLSLMYFYAWFMVLIVLELGRFFWRALFLVLCCLICFLTTNPLKALWIMIVAPICIFISLTFMIASSPRMYF